MVDSTSTRKSSRARGEDIDVGIGIRVADRHDVELPRIGQRPNSEDSLPTRFSSGNTSISGAPAKYSGVCGPCRSALTTFTRCRTMSLSIVTDDAAEHRAGDGRLIAAFGRLLGDLLSL